MIALNIEEMKPFTTKLFVGEVFDRFLVKEASITTFIHLPLTEPYGLAIILQRRRKPWT